MFPPSCFALYKAALSKPTNKGLLTLYMWHEGAGSEVWPRAGRVAAHPWMTHPTRPEGTDNGQSLLTLYWCQNVSTFNNVTSTPYMVKLRQRISILWSRGCWWEGVLSRQPCTSDPKAVSSSVSCGPLLVSHSSLTTPIN